MKRDFRYINRYLNNLAKDVYAQPDSDGHTEMLREVIEKWIKNMPTLKSVLDIGCGATAIAETFFTPLGIGYTGISLGEDYFTAKAAGKNVRYMDMSFLRFEDRSFDMIWARHSLEHSPMPILTLMEFRRVAKKWLCAILPKPQFFTKKGLNHYSVLDQEHWLSLMDRAGWKPMWEDHDHQQEFRFMMEKK